MYDAASPVAPSGSTTVGCARARGGEGEDQGGDDEAGHGAHPQPRLKPSTATLRAFSFVLPSAGRFWRCCARCGLSTRTRSPRPCPGHPGAVPRCASSKGCRRGTRIANRGLDSSASAFHKRRHFGVKEHFVPEYGRT